MLKVAVTAARSRRASRCRAGRQGRVAARAQGKQQPAVTPVATEDTDDEVAALMRQAARLRADVELLEIKQSEQKALETLQLFQSFDTDGSGAVDESELQQGWKELKGEELDDAMIVRMWAHLDLDGSGVLEIDEFDINKVQQALEKVKAEDKEKEILAQQEVERLAAEEAAQRLKEYLSKPPGTDDTGLGTRVLSAGAYLLPLIDIAKLGLPLAYTFAPQFMPYLALVVQAQQAVFFGPLILFFIFDNISRQQDKPALLRFNLRQAVLLDISILVPNLIRAILSATDNHGFELLAGSIGFVVITAFCLLAMGYCLLGETSELPFFSASAVNALHREQGVPTDVEDKTPPTKS